MSFWPKNMLIFVFYVYATNSMVALLYIIVKLF